MKPEGLRKKRIRSAKYRLQYKEAHRCTRCGGELQGDLNVSCVKCTTRRFTLPFGKFPNELEV
jgi:hypothetical protein